MADNPFRPSAPIRGALMLTAAPLHHPLSERPLASGVIGRLVRAIQRSDERVGAVRGAGVAIESLVAMMFCSKEIANWTIYAPFEVIKATRAWTERYAKGSAVLAFPESTEEWVDGRETDVWFDPSGATPLSIQLRGLFGEYNNYPIVSVQHTLSLRGFITQYFPKLLAGPTYPWDRLVCLTNAGAKALGNLLSFSAELAGFGQESMEGNFRGEIEVIPLPVDTEKFHPTPKRDHIRKRMSIAVDAFVVLYLGALSSAKADLTPFFVALREIVVSRPMRRIEFIIAGGGQASYVGELQQRIRDEQLASVVRVVGKISAEEKVWLYQCSDVFFSPSDTLTESFGLTPIEAMACGVPQLVSDWNGYKETVVHGRTGFRLSTLWGSCDDDLADPNYVLGTDFDHILLAQSVVVDLREFKDYLLQLIDNESLRRSMAEESRRVAQEQYSLRVVSTQYVRLFESLSLQRERQRHRVTMGHLPKRERHYFRCFRHYSTNVLTREMRISRLSHDVSLLVKSISKASGRPVVSSELVMELFVLLEERDLEVGECYRRLKLERLEQVSRVNRHLLWLAKNGHILISPGR